MKKILALIMAGILVLGLTGCMKLDVEEQDITERHNAEISMEIKETIDLTVDKEEKQKFYNNFKLEKIMFYGNTIVMNSTDGTRLRIINDENAQISEIKPYKTMGDETINVSLYSVKIDGKTESYCNVQAIKENKIKDMWLEPDDNISSVKDELGTEKLSEIVKLIFDTYKDIKYIHTSTDGVDTIELGKTGEIIEVRINPETNEIHSFIIAENNKEDGVKAIFYQTDVSKFERPSELITSKSQKRYIISKYVD